MSILSEPGRALPAGVVVPAAGVGPRDPGRRSGPGPSVIVGLGLAAGALIAGAAAAFGPGLGLVAIAGVAFLIFVARNPAAGALTVVAVAPIVSGIRRGDPIPGLRLSEALIVGVAVTILVTARRGETPRWRTFDWLALAYAVVTFAAGALDLAIRHDSFSASHVGDMLGPLQFFLLYRAVLTALPEREQRLRALRLILLASIPVAFMAFAQVANVPGARALQTSITDMPKVANSFGYSLESGVGRATGLFPHWHTLGGYLFVVILVGAGVALHRVRGVLGPRALGIVLAIAALALVLTVSITTIVATAVGVLLLGLSARRLRQVLGVLVVVALVGGVAFAPTFIKRFDQQYRQDAYQTKASPLIPQTLSFRYRAWTQDYLPIVRSRWLTGWGPGDPPVRWAYTETLYLSMVLRGGLPLLAVYLALMWALYRIGRRVARTGDPLDRTLGDVLAILVVVLLFVHAVTALFLTSGLPHLLWALAALAMAGAGRSSATGSADVAGPAVAGADVAAPHQVAAAGAPVAEKP